MSEKKFKYRYFIPLDEGGMPKVKPLAEGQDAVFQQSCRIKEHMVVDTIDERTHLKENEEVVQVIIDRSIEGSMNPDKIKAPKKGALTGAST